MWFAAQYSSFPQKKTILYKNYSNRNTATFTTSFRGHDPSLNTPACSVVNLITI